MSQTRHEFLSEAAIAPYATSPHALWLFSDDGSNLLFANAAAAALLKASPSRENHTALPREFAAHLARSAATLQKGAPPRLERLRGLGTAFGRPLTCRCARIPVATSGGEGILVIAVENAGTNLSLHERARYLIEDSGAAAAFSPDGSLLCATEEASGRIGRATSLSDLKSGTPTLRVGSGDDTVVFAFLQDDAQQSEGALPDGASVAPSNLLDLSPIAEAITAMARTPLQIAAVSHGRQSEKAPSPAATDPDPDIDRVHPQRFVWQTDAENRFTIAQGEFAEIAGPRTANLLGRFWGEISAKLALDPDGKIARALVSRNTWSGITVNWPTADGDMLAVTLSGIPTFDADRTFRGYRGLGVWHDPRTREAREPEPAAIAQPSYDVAPSVTAPSEAARSAPALDPTLTENPVHLVEPPAPVSDRSDTVVAIHAAPEQPNAAPEDDRPLPTENVVPFPIAPLEPKPETRAPGLNPAERSAFRDLGSRLAARLRGADELARGLMEKPSEEDEEPAYVPPVLMSSPQARPDRDATAVVSEPLVTAEDPLGAQRPLLDKLPIGLLIYRGASLIYANPAFLAFAGRTSLSDLAAAGGLEAMDVEFESPESGAGERRLRIFASRGQHARIGQLVTVELEGAKAQMLMLEPDRPAEAQNVAPVANDLAALLDIAADGMVTVDDRGIIVSANPRAETLFGFEPHTLAGYPFGALFAPDSERIAQARLQRLLHSQAIADEADQEVIGRRRLGGLISLQMILGRANPTDTRVHVLFRDLTRWKEAEREMLTARQQAERESEAKSEFLAKISHEMRTPLNSIIGFSEVMTEERFGPVGNERYRDYLKDIQASGAHLVSLLNDLLDLSKIEAGKMELNFERVDLNEVTQQSVAMMQAQAGRARVIVRTALSMNIPEIVADARSVRQIVLNLLSNSIKFTAAGGQVIVSTAINERGEVMLRVRDTGIGMSEKDLQTALQPFRQITTSRTDATTGTGLGLPLTKALVEANRARFSIKSAVNAGTLVEIAFPAGRAPSA